MNKKLLLGAVLLVGLGTTFTSCVDSTESASVTAIREAKAEQLKALADLSKAQADAAIIVANAEQAAQAANQALQEAQAALLRAQAEAMSADADYKKAQADLLAAQAEYERARAAYLNAQTENEKAMLEKELALKDAELRKALAEAEAQEIRNKHAQVDLDNAQAQYDQKKAEAEARLKLLEAQIAQQEVYNQQALVTLKDMEYNLNKKIKDDATKEAADIAQKIKTCMEAYEIALRNLNSAKETLLRDQKTLYAYQAGLLSEQNVVEENIATTLKNIEESKQIIKEQEAIIDAFSQYAGKAVTEADVTKAFADYQKAKEAEETAKTASDDADKAYETAENNLKGQPNKYQSYVDKTIRTFKGYNDANEPVYDNSYTYIVYDKKANKADKYEFYIENYSYNQPWNMPAEYAGNYCLYVRHEVYDYKEVLMIIINEKGEKEEYKVWSLIPTDDPSQYQDIEPATTTYTPVYSNEDWDLEVVEENGYSIPVELLSSYKALLNDGKGLNDWKDLRVDLINNSTENNLKDLETNLETAKAAQVAAKKAYDTAYKAEEELNAAQIALQIAQEKAASAKPADKEAADAAVVAAKEVVTAKQTAVNELKVSLSEAKIALSNANYEVESCNNQIIILNNNLAAQANSVDEVNELVDNIIKEAGNNEDLRIKYNDAAEDKAVKNSAYDDAKNDTKTYKGIYIDIEFAYENEQLYNGADTPAQGVDNWGNVYDYTQKYFSKKVLAAQQEINTQNGNIERYEQVLKDYNETLDDLKSDKPTKYYVWQNSVKVPYGNAVEAQEAIIENDKLEVEVAEQRCEIAKAALESALKQQETPAE